MAPRPRKGPRGMYTIQGKEYEEVIGTRAKVWHGTAFKTSGGLTRDKLMMNKHGRIVSKKKHATAKRNKRLEKAGYYTKKGTFGAFSKDGTRIARVTRKRRRRRRSK